MTAYASRDCGRMSENSKIGQIIRKDNSFTGEYISIDSRNIANEKDSEQ